MHSGRWPAHQAGRTAHLRRARYRVGGDRFLEGPPTAEGNPSIEPSSPSIVMLSGSRFIGGCAAASAAVVVAGHFTPFPTWLLAAEVLLTILGLFLFGSFRYQIHKNALTYGMLFIIAATFCSLATSTWHVEIAEHGIGYWIREHLLTFAGLDELIHADTMLFILGLTLFVAV